MRQRRDKKPESKQPSRRAKGGGWVSGAPQDSGNDPDLADLKHQHIPKDANGDPVFLILPKGLQARYDEWMANLEAFWKATKDPVAVSEAHTLTLIYRQVPPMWLDAAVYRLASQRRGPGHAKAAREAHVRATRYAAVRDAKASGLAWPDAYERASDVLAGTSAAAETDAMFKSYKRVKRDLKAGRGGLYFLPHDQNAAARDALEKGAIVPTRAKRESSARPKKK